MLPNLGSDSGLKWLQAYEKEDAPYFPFRSVDTAAIIQDILDRHFVVLYGEQGSGKTSYIQAQLIPALELGGNRVITIRSICDPIQELIAALQDLPAHKLSPDQKKLDPGQLIDQQFSLLNRDLVIILDPCENMLFTKSPLVSRKFFTTIARILEKQAESNRVNIHIMVNVRSDFLPDLIELISVVPLLKNPASYQISHLNNTEIDSFVQIFTRITNIHLSQNLRNHITDLAARLNLRTVDIQLIICFIYEEILKIHGAAVGSAYLEMDYDQFIQLGNIPGIIRSFLNNEIERTLASFRNSSFYNNQTVNLPPSDPRIFRLDSLLRRCGRLVLITFLSNRKMAVFSSCRAILFQVLKDESGILKRWIAVWIVALVRQGIIRRAPEDPDKLELVSGTLAASISNWIDSSMDIQSTIDASFRLRPVFAECLSFNRLMTLKELDEISKVQQRVGLSTWELRLIFQSALANAHRSHEWYLRLKNEYIPIIDIIQDEKSRQDFRDRIKLVKGLFKIGSAVLPELLSFLKDEYPQVRAHAVAAFEQLDRSGSWRRFLHFEAYVNTGKFLVGTDWGNFADEGPQHILELGPYYIGKTLVTYADYKKFMDEREEPYDITPGMERHPITNLSWYQINEYSRWASLRLPNEPEWEIAASWDPERNVKRVYPWGNRFDETRCNMRAEKLNSTTPVGRYSPTGDSAFGCKDMAGNVWEWTNSVFMPYPYDKYDGREEKSTSGSRVIRGGSYECGATYVTCTVRLAFDPYSMRPDLGFRAVLDIPDVNLW
jgi:hypothetical protein